MSASETQSSLNSGTTWGPNDVKSSENATPATSAGSATAAGHGDHPQDNADDSNANLPGSKIGPQNEDLEGDQMSAPGEGEVMGAQLNKKNAGWGEEGSFTSDLDRQKAEQRGAREDIQAARESGENIGGVEGRVSNEGIDQV